MSRYVFKLPDLGEGTVSAEIISWRARAGDEVAEDQALVEMSTDKAVVEVPSPVSGRLVSVAGEPGQAIAVGAELAVFEIVADDVTSGAASADADFAPATVAAAGALAASDARSPATSSPESGRGRVKASPATRRRAREAGIDLRELAGSGPGGRIQAADLDQALNPRSATAPTPAAPAGSGRDAIDEIPVIGVRRLIAERMAEAKRKIPHFSYVEEVDVTELEALRQHLNSTAASGTAPLSLLPLIVAALVRVLRDFPQCNAHYDEARNMILRHRAVHVGIATQTPDGLKVPVVRDAGQRDLAGLAAEIRRVAELARGRQAPRDILAGSTITVTSLGKLGGIVSTPILNAPEVAIVGINKAVERVVVLDGKMVIRRMMNLSSSFDHRFVDGYDAAAMIQALKTRLEHPATIFM
jgi:2-oxoisovalerate dehydrogenase E2 component (dihydrolipoyl transacylase)